MEEEARSSPPLKRRYLDVLQPTVRDVEVVAHGQTPHFSSDAGGNALPPQISHSTRCAPTRQSEGRGRHPEGHVSIPVLPVTHIVLQLGKMS